MWQELFLVGHQVTSRCTSRQVSMIEYMIYMYMQVPGYQVVVDILKCGILDTNRVGGN
jgi:hypothetical protein